MRGSAPTREIQKGADTDREIARGAHSEGLAVASINAMPTTGDSPDVLVVGGGIIGLAVAWRARQRGMTVTVLDRERTGRGASRVAAGMLAPVAEVEFGEAGRRILELGLRSAEIWPAFADDLQVAAGAEVGLMRTGTLLVARDEDEARELERQIAFRDSLGLRAERLRPSEARAREPALAPTVRLAMQAPDDSSVDPRLVLAALRRACESSGVHLREHARVVRIESDSVGPGRQARRTGVTVDSDDGIEFVPGGLLVVAAGTWVEQIGGLPGEARMPVRPVKG